MTRVLLVRHGRTQWNTGTERFRGRADIDLDKVGLQQAEAVARRVAKWQVASVYSSPQRRALRTAEPIAHLFSLPVQPLEGLIDMDFGEWQGLSLPEAEAKDKELYHLWFHQPHQVTFPGGESLEQVRSRLADTVEMLQSRHPEENIVLVSHRVVCKTLLCLFLGVDNSFYWKVGQDTCALSVIELREDRAPVIALLNDICHLKHLR